MRRLQAWLTTPVLLFCALAIAVSALPFAMQAATGAMPSPEQPGALDLYPADWSALRGGGQVFGSSRPAMASERGSVSLFAAVPGQAGLARWRYSSADGSLAGPQPTGARASSGRPLDPAVLAAADGSYHLVWCETVDGQNRPVYAHLGADLALIAPPLPLPGAADGSETPSMAVLPNGHVLLAWATYDRGYHLWLAQVANDTLLSTEQLPASGRLAQLLGRDGGADLAYVEVAAGRARIAYQRLNGAGAAAAAPESLDPQAPALRSLQLLTGPDGRLLLLAGQRQESYGRQGVEAGLLFQRTPTGDWAAPAQVVAGQPLFDLTAAVAGGSLQLAWTQIGMAESMIFASAVPLQIGESVAAPRLISARLGSGGNHLPVLAPVGDGILVAWTEATSGPGELRVRDTLHAAPVPAVAHLGLDPAHAWLTAGWAVVQDFFHSLVGVLFGLPDLLVAGLVALLAPRLLGPDRLRSDWLLLGILVLSAWLLTWIPNPGQLGEPLWPTQLPWPLWVRLAAPLAATAAMLGFAAIRRWRPASEPLSVIPLMLFWALFQRLVLQMPFVAGFR